MHCHLYNVYTITQRQTALIRSEIGKLSVERNQRHKSSCLTLLIYQNKQSEKQITSEYFLKNIFIKIKKK